MTLTKIFTYKSCCFLTSALISLLKSFKFWSKFAIACPFCLCMSFISPANLPSYLRCNPGNWRDRPATFQWDNVYPPSLEWKKLTKQSSPVLNEYPSDHWSFFFLCKLKCVFSHRFIITFLIQLHLSPRFLYWRDESFHGSETMSWSLSLSGEWASWNWPGVDFTKGFKTWHKFSTEIRFMLIPIIVLFIAHEFITGKFWHNK